MGQRRARNRYWMPTAGRGHGGFSAVRRWAEQACARARERTTEPTHAQQASVRRGPPLSRNALGTGPRPSTARPERASGGSLAASRACSPMLSARPTPAAVLLCRAEGTPRPGGLRPGLGALLRSRRAASVIQSLSAQPWFDLGERACCTTARGSLEEAPGVALAARHARRSGAHELASRASPRPSARRCPTASSKQ